MQPTPLAQIAGTVVLSRQVVIPPRPATETSRGYDGGSYEEVTIQTSDCALLGEFLDGLTAYQAIRFTTGDAAHAQVLAQLVPGATVVLMVSPFVDTFRVKGKLANSVGYRFAALRGVTAAALVAAGRAAS
jgi:hypothetical protein